MARAGLRNPTSRNGRRAGAARRAALAVIVAAGVACGVTTTRVARAQLQQATVEVDGADEQQPKPGGFSVKKEDQKVIEQLEDFERYRDKKAWDRAFKALSAVAEAKGTGGMAPAKDGFWVPTRQRVMQSLVSLSPEGKEAYRLFYDAQAKRWWDQCLAREAAGDNDTVAMMKNGVEQYLVATVGDKLADHLGDALMETGDYTGAAHAYELVLTARPDSDIPPLRLQVKRATALARGGRVEQFKELASQIREKHPGETVKVGGREVAVEEFLAGLAKPQASRVAATKPTTGPALASSEVSAEPTGPVALPGDEKAKPAWQCVYFDAAARDKAWAQMNSNGWGQQMGGMLNVIPAACTDGKRIYCNWYGTIWAIDGESGKIVWWSTHFKNVVEKFQEMVQWQIEQPRFTVTLAGDNLLTVALRLDRLNNQEPFRLTNLEPATGKKRWSTDSGALQGWAFIGQPLVVDGTIYVTAHPSQQQDIHLLAVNLADGKLLWESTLGQPQVGNNWRGMPVYPLPVLQHLGGTIYVCTNNGAVLAFDTASRSIQWAFTYETIFQGNENGRVFFNGQQTQQPPEPLGTAFLREGVLYFKDRQGEAMYALDLAGPKLLFKRPVESDQSLVAVDDAGYSLVGPDVTFIDRATSQIRWSAKLPVMCDVMRPAMAGPGQLLLFTSRGIARVDRNEPTDKLVPFYRGYDLDSLGGALLRCGDKLVSVSNLAVTAYKVGQETRGPGDKVTRGN